MDLHNYCFKCMLLNNVSPDNLSDPLYYRYKYFETINKECKVIFGKYHFQLTEKDIENFDWRNPRTCSILSEVLIDYFQNYVDWKCISIYGKLSESFIEKFKDKVDWQEISQFQKLSEDLFLLF